MALLLKFVAGASLAITWFGFLLIALTALVSPDTTTKTGGFWIYGIVGVLGLSIPAAILFAFAMVVDDVSEMKDHLAAMRRYYEPERPT